MRIAFYAPFKPLDHPNPSGDLVIAGGLVDHLIAGGNDIRVMSSLRSRWIYWKPWLLLRALIQRRRITRELARQNVDLWLTYHTYYKAPDLIGPFVAAKLNIPYVIFQGIYSTRVRRKWQTRPGYTLNTRALLAADLVLTNRRADLKNLRRLLPDDRLHYLTPGIYPARFTADPTVRRNVRAGWQFNTVPVILTAAMFRADVKTEGLIWVIESCARLLGQGHDLRLVIAGDGREKARLVDLARKLLGDKALFVGRIPRQQMAEFYNGGDLFVFPGINESLGMVYLEAQSCGLPVVAFETGGVPEVVKNGQTGLLTPLFDRNRFDAAVAALITDPRQRQRMGAAAAAYIRENHDLEKNYRRLEQLLRDVKTSHRDSSNA